MLAHVHELNAAFSEPLPANEARDIAASTLEPPAILCVGRSVLMRQVLDWQGMLAGERPRNLDPLGRGRPAEAS